MEGFLWDRCLPARGFLGSAAGMLSQSVRAVRGSAPQDVSGMGRVNCVCPTGARASKCLA